MFAVSRKRPAEMSLQQLVQQEHTQGTVVATVILDGEYRILDWITVVDKKVSIVSLKRVQGGIASKQLVLLLNIG